VKEWDTLNVIRIDKNPGGGDRGDAKGGRREELGRMGNGIISLRFAAGGKMQMIKVRQLPEGITCTPTSL